MTYNVTVSIDIARHDSNTAPHPHAPHNRGNRGRIFPPPLTPPMGFLRDRCTTDANMHSAPEPKNIFKHSTRISIDAAAL